MTNPKEEPRQMGEPNESSGESQPVEIPTITGSPWRNRSEFAKQLQAATLESLRLQEQGELFRWNWVNIFGDKISIALENLPKDKEIGPHALIHMTREEDAVQMEINTVGVSFHRDVIPFPLEEKHVLDFGEDEQITTFIEMCARALEVGIPPDGIMDAAMNSRSRPNDSNNVNPEDRAGRRRESNELYLRDFSRQLSERQFL